VWDGQQEGHAARQAVLSQEKPTVRSTQKRLSITGGVCRRQHFEATRLGSWAVVRPEASLPRDYVVHAVRQCMNPMQHKLLVTYSQSCHKHQLSTSKLESHVVCAERPRQSELCRVSGAAVPAGLPPPPRSGGSLQGQPLLCGEARPCACSSTRDHPRMSCTPKQA
jgi:hypothetical protein